MQSKGNSQIDGQGIAWEFLQRHLFIYSIMHSTLSFLAMELKPEKRQVRLQAMLVQIRRCFQAEVHFDRGVSREIRQIKVHPGVG